MSLYGFFASLGFWPSLFLVLAGAFALGYAGAPLWAWTAAFALLLTGLGAPAWVWILTGVLLAVFNLKPLRRALVTRPLMGWMKRLGILPRISKTERQAIEAGTVWVDGELFSGKPDFQRLLSEDYPDLTGEERAFLEGPVAELCRMCDDWETWSRRDLSPEVWEYLKKERFFGMIIPKEHGGLGFSPSAVSAVIARLASRSMTLCVTVMVPNSLGPAELLHLYGTPEQKDYWLPRLARGEEIPCFALTEPGAGSDAGGMSSHGEVFRGDDGRLYLRLNWNKRYITLAAVSTVLGLAFKLRDPHNLLGKGPEPGITAALVPSNTPGVVLGRRHDPLTIPFYNCPTEGHDVVVPVDAIIGGPAGAGEGWKMLMECLAAGRGIMLPASSTGAVKTAARVVGAYAAIRRQFGLPIGRFEGIEEPLSRIGGLAYTLEAARRYTCGGLDTGAKPSVVSAIVKYHFTESFRQVVTDGMDVLGGAGISLGPRNTFGLAWMGAPISITVEGANILTRTLMIFGQGAIRCHPWAYAEIRALQEGDVAGFDRAFFGHVGHVVRNAARAKLLTLTRGRLHRPVSQGPAARYEQKLAWASAVFAWVADVAMAGLGGDLKRKETLTGRLGDVFSWLYLGTAVLRRYEAEGRRPEDRAFFEWSMEYALARIQEAFEGFFANFPGLLGLPMRTLVLGWFRLSPFGRGPSDQLGHAIARALQTPGEQRDRITEGLYIPEDPEEAIGRIERAFVLCARADEILGRIKQAIRRKELPRQQPETLLEPAVARGLITGEEAELVRRAEAAREDVIQVDSFTLEEFLQRGLGPWPGATAAPAAAPPEPAAPGAAGS